MCPGRFGTLLPVPGDERIYPGGLSLSIAAFMGSGVA